MAWMDLDEHLTSVLQHLYYITKFAILLIFLI